MDYLGLHGQYGIAHRGGAQEHLENSPSAFQHAAELGFRVVETDLHSTMDGVLAVIHDRDLARTAGNKVQVSRLTWSELSTMRLRNGESVLRFEELLELLPGIRLNVDPKGASAVQPLIKLLNEQPQIQSRVCIGNFETDRLAVIRKALPQVATSLGSSEVRRLLLAVRTGGRYRFPNSCVAVQVPTRAFGVRIVSEAFVDFVQSHGRHVHVWTIDDEAEMRRLLQLGVNAVMTDRPTALRQVMQDLGIWQSGRKDEDLP